jgi:hypothetical protein
MSNNYESNYESAALRPDERRQISAFELLAAAGVSAAMVYDGDVDGCPHCAVRVFSEAA